MKTKTYREEAQASQTQMSLPDFLKSYNKNMPSAFPRASAALLQKFKNEHPGLFTRGDLWSLDQHRKRIMDWLPLNNIVL